MTAPEIPAEIEASVLRAVPGGAMTVFARRVMALTIAALPPDALAVLRGEAVAAPREATGEMTRAAHDKVAICTPDGTWALARDEAARAWAAMIAASPWAPKLCEDCGKNPSDPGSRLCGGCQMYKDYTS